MTETRLRVAEVTFPQTHPELISLLLGLLLPLRCFGRERSESSAVRGSTGGGGDGGSGKDEATKEERGGGVVEVC